MKMGYHLLTDNQRRIQINAIQLFEALMDGEHRLSAFSGSMVWKSSGGKKYLFKLADRRGYGRSMGQRSPETEKIHADTCICRLQALACRECRAQSVKETA